MKFLGYLALVFGCFSSANATVIHFASNSTLADSSQNNNVGNNVVIQKNPAWVDPIAGSQWVSYTNTGDPSSVGYSSPVNGTMVSFFQHFTLTAADLSTDGIVSLYADDSSSVVLNGITLLAEPSTSGNSYSTCSDVKPNCKQLTTVVLPHLDLLLGANTLRFDVTQHAGSSYGLDYSGSVGAANATAPEPGTWVLMTTAAILLGAGLLKRRGMRAPAAMAARA